MIIYICGEYANPTGLIRNGVCNQGPVTYWIITPQPISGIKTQRNVLNR